MISPEQMCEYLNRQAVKRPGLLTAVMRTTWLLDFDDIPQDMDVMQTSTGCPVVDVIGLINGMLVSSGQRIRAVNIKDSVQFIVENTNEKVPTAE